MRTRGAKLILHPQLPFDKVEQHLRDLPQGPIVTADEALEKGTEQTRNDLAVRIVQNGRFLDYLGRQSEVFPVENISRAKKLPPFVWIFHGGKIRLCRSMEVNGLSRSFVRRDRM